MAVPSNLHPLASQPALRSLLDQLHATSLEQEGAQRGAHFPRGPQDNFEEKLVALDEDKARDMYLILRAMGARRVVEAGTSYGVSLLWLLAAVTANDAALPTMASPARLPALVVGTENEPKKAAIALEHVRSAFGGLEPAPLQLLVGDLLETLSNFGFEDDSVDALLLDIWAPLALPTLKILVPKFRRGAAVFIDNTVSSEERYAALLSYVRAPENGFLCSTLPHSGGFDLCIFVGQN